MKLASVLVISFALLTLAVGCGPDISNLPKTVPASGTVTLDGQPVDKASVSFIAESGNYHAVGVTDATGKFVLNAFKEKEGAVPGSYKVEVNKTVVSGGEGSTEGGEGAAVNVQFGLPAKYATITTSGLKDTIPEAGTSTLKIELTAK